MTEQQHVQPPVPEWNPLELAAPETKPLASSGGRASIVVRRWSGRDRLAYEDAVTEQMMTKDQRGEDTVKVGSYRLFALSLTVVGSVGFDRFASDARRADTSVPFLGGDRASREADLLLLNGDTYDEIRRIATKHQPLPRMDDEEKDPDDESGLPDPSPTPSTSQTPTGGVVNP